MMQTPVSGLAYPAFANAFNLPALLVATGVAILLIAAAVSMVLVARRLFARLAGLEMALEDADDRFDEFVRILGGELDAIKGAGEGQIRRLERLGRQVEQVSVDIVRRDSRGTGDASTRRADVVLAARGGQGVEELVREHGLSADEAELLVMLHGEAAAGDPRPVR